MSGYKSAGEEEEVIERKNQRESENFQDSMFVLFFVIPHSLRNEYLTTPLPGRPVGPNPTRLIFGLYTQMVYGPVAFRVTRACLATRSPDTSFFLKKTYGSTSASGICYTGFKGMEYKGLKMKMNSIEEIA